MKAIAFIVSAVLLVVCTPPAEPQIEEREGKVDSADGVSISYRVTGEGNPALVFVHGWTGHQGYWEPQVRHFARSHTVVTLDLGGHGASGRDRASWTVPAFGNDVAAVVCELALDEVVLVGHSLGGPVIVAAASLIPERVIGLVGVDTLKNVGRHHSEEFIERFLSQFDGDFHTGYKAFIRSQFPPDEDPEAIESATAGLPAAEPEDALEMLKLYFEWLNGGFLKILPKIEVPIRCINSDRSPTDIDGARRYATSFDVVLMPGTSHLPMLDDPETFNRHLSQAIQYFERGQIPPQQKGAL